MRAGIKRTAGVAAAMAIALHTILWAAVAPFAASSVDPFTVICHSEASGPADQAPVNGTLPPAHACDHCNLCSATAPAAVPDALVLGQLAPAKLLLVLEPVSLSGRNGITASPHRARGPPFFA